MLLTREKMKHPVKIPWFITADGRRSSNLVEILQGSLAPKKYPYIPCLVEGRTDKNRNLLLVKIKIGILYGVLLCFVLKAIGIPPPKKLKKRAQHGSTPAAAMEHLAHMGPGARHFRCRLLWPWEHLLGTGATLHALGNLEERNCAIGFV